ncbi:lipopolysaccharide transport periplasmic protein LptA [Cardinium endosymbiont of Sogatella furcifera]|uniref:OstA-like protein n=1 Tax=Cardinium endosymbiont of Sogatella furcifera TaxID=650378 RepID=UPI000E105446|nr:OstA-like protein [Cardinium endosymbiont of Sogatella furcifera]AXI23968.1 lipopolysaccharide transport periplasmic protein LptA [Cardinium endosymbiont of Sogatella furcifera]
MLKKNIYSILYLLACPLCVLADAVTYKADRLEGELVNDKPCKKLEGNVVFTFDANGIVLTADKAYKYDEEDRIEAQGNVQIVDQEGNVIKSAALIYYPTKKQAVFENNVSYTSKKATFYTPKLTYNVEKKQGEFLQGGKLVQDQMVLTSSKGFYDGANHQVTFLDQVVLVDPNYRLHCDQLNYHTESETAYFQGATKIIHEDGVLTTLKGGHYLLPRKQLAFDQGTLITQDIILTADRLTILDGKDCAATGHVLLRAQKHDATIVGEKARYLAKEKKGEITGHPLLTKVVNDQTIYLRADTFVVLEKSIPDQPPEQEIHALHRVRLYQEEVQGVADGAVYNSRKNTIHLHNKPIIWCSNYQITGEEVYLVIEEGKEVKLFVDKNLFMVSADSMGHYNQVKGHKMVASFKEGAIEKMSIIGNSESLYFALGGKDELMGMNHIKCDRMEITMSANTLVQMICKPKPSGLFYPAEKLEGAQMKLDGFVWHGEKWPTKENILEKAPKKAINKSG